jgi:glycosyltransferase involved in cell wall biosynthesis
MEGRALTAGVRALYLAGERLGSVTVAVSPTVAGRLERWGVPAPRIEIVPNGIDVARFRFDAARRTRTRRRLGLPEDAYVVGGIGRLTAGKRFDVLVRGLALLPRDHWLLLVGGGPGENVLRRTAHEAGVADRVLFTGERPGIPDGSPGPGLPALTAAMDVLASPSPQEAFGLAVVEALASGLPVLYASCPAVEDLPARAAAGARRVRGGPDAYARAITEVRAGGPRPRTPPDAAHHYCITRTAARLMDVYAAALSPSTSSRSTSSRSTSAPSSRSTSSRSTSAPSTPSSPSMSTPSTSALKAPRPARPVSSQGASR